MPPDEVARLRAIIEFQSAISAELNEPARVMEMVMARTEELTAADGAAVEVVEDDDMVYRAVSGIVSSMLGLRLDVSASLSGLCVAEGVPLRCDDTLTDERVDREACQRAGIRSMMVVPLVLDGQPPIGVLKLVSARPDGFSELDVETLGRMAHFIALSLRHATDWEALDRKVRIDQLTGVANRAALLERVTVWLEENDVDGAVTLHFLDLDGFKQINDAQGHAAGDVRLKEVAALLNSSVRGDDLVARLGGDEFVVVCRHIGLDDAVSMGERLADVAGASVGIARSVEGDTADELLGRADEAMYERKRTRQEANGSPTDAGT
ncbi:MAG TPA: sensor domain-containing diguanylate cyclase [Acidimicrobiales bacterium]